MRQLGIEETTSKAALGITSSAPRMKSEEIVRHLPEQRLVGEELFGQPGDLAGTRALHGARQD